MAKKRSARAANQELGLEGRGVEPVRIQEIDDAIAEYVPLRDARVEASKHEVAAKKKLVDLIHAHKESLNDGKGNLSYKMEDDGLLTLTPQEEKLKIVIPKEKKVVEDTTEKGLS